MLTAGGEGGGGGANQTKSRGCPLVFLLSFCCAAEHHDLMKMKLGPVVNRRARVLLSAQT